LKVTTMDKMVLTAWHSLSNVNFPLHKLAMVPDAAEAQQID
jgi:hypothetical protein